MNRLTYTMLLIVGVFSTFWIFRPDHQAVSYHSNNTTIKPLVDPHTLPPSPNINNKKNDNDFKLSNTSTTDDSYCREACNKSLELLHFQGGLSDEEYEKTMSRTEDLAAYLRQNPDALTELIKLVDTSDGNKRSIIMKVFSQLDIESRLLLGEVLLESASFRNRYDGVNFLAQPDIIDEQLAHHFLEILAVEPEQFVRNALVQALSQPDKFLGNKEVLDTLEQITYQERDDYITRGEALLARVQLEEDSKQVFIDSITAIRSQESDYQLYGLRALEQIITRQTSYKLGLSQENKNEAKYLFDELRNSDYDEIPVNVLREANNIHARHFE